MVRRGVSQKGLILDRDGTLVDVVRDEATGTIRPAMLPSQLRLLPGVITGLRAAEDAGFTLAIATNQPGAALGLCAASDIERTNEALVALLAEHGVTIAAVATCLHHPEGGPGGDSALVRPCDCRKPGPGLLRTLLADLDLDPSRTFVVGDTDGDLQAAPLAGVRCALIHDAGRCELCPFRGLDSAGGTRRAPDVSAATFDAVIALLVAR